MTFSEELSRRSEAVQKIIYTYLPAEEGFQKTLLEAMNYSMTAGGKRLRPLLMQETYRLFGGNGKAVEPFMAAMEMIHTHSLVHDDLPAMDNDEYRRGKKTTHIVYGEAMAILAGDGLLNYAYETACRAFVLEPENPHIGEAMAILAGKTGTAEYSSDIEKNHSWFVGFTNVDNPELAICVLIESSDGQVKAVNVAKEIFDSYYY